MNSIALANPEKRLRNEERTEERKKKEKSDKEQRDYKATEKAERLS